VKILLECKQPVPEFLEDVKPADGILNFDDDTDAEGEDGDNENKENGGDSWASWNGADNNEATKVAPTPEPSFDSAPRQAPEAEEAW
jgi:hypothetical protein